MWTDINCVAIDKLEGLQNQFLRALFATPRSTPLPSLCWESGTLTMNNRIIMKKLLLYHHLVSLGEDTLAKQIANIQSRMGYPGLINECEKFVLVLRLPDIRRTSLSKQQWKTTVKRRIFLKNKEDLLESIVSKDYKKLDARKLSAEKFELKPYIKSNNLHDSRLIFQSRCKMMKTVKMNFKSNPKFIQEQWRCSGCLLLDSQEHLLSCAGYAHLRVGRDLDKDSDLVAYYRSIFKLRTDE